MSQLEPEPEPVLVFKSHIEGKNADVEIWPDRLEWTRESGIRSAAGRWGAAVATAGVSLLKTGVRGTKDTNTIPIRMIQGVTTHRAGLRFTVVKVTTGGDTVEFHVSKADAERVKATLINLMNRDATPAPHAPPPTQAAPATAESAASVADELTKLAELQRAGVLSMEEFDAQKARLLNPS